MQSGGFFCWVVDGFVHCRSALAEPCWNPSLLLELKVDFALELVQLGTKICEPFTN
jgi:hypothetical protein